MTMNSSNSVYDELSPEQAARALALYESGMDLDDAIEILKEKDHEYDNGYYCGYISDDVPETISLDEIGIDIGYYD